MALKRRPPYAAEVFACLFSVFFQYTPLIIFLNKMKEETDPMQKQQEFKNLLLQLGQ